MAMKEKKIANTGIKNWNFSNVPSLKGLNIFITGGNSGLGLEASKILAQKGANLLFTSRSEEKAKDALIKIKGGSSSKVDYALMDLSDLESVKKATNEIKTKMPSIDILINNAGIMMTPQTYTKDGHELQFATNHLGHFYLNSLIFDLVNKETGRIVVISSLVHKDGQINFRDLTLKDEYTPYKAYSQSKLANLMYAFELDRKLKSSSSKIQVVACHPGYSATNLQSTGPTGIAKFLMKFSNKLLAQSAKDGAMPTVFSATGNIIAGAYYGPQRMKEVKGEVGDANVAIQALDENASAKLWSKTEELVGQKFNI